MKNVKKSIRLNPAERQALVTLYLEKQLAVDRYQNRPNELKDLTNSFNSLTGRSDPPEDVLHYMRTQRKRGKWPKLGDKARKLSDHLEEVLNPEEIKILVGIYVQIGRNHAKGNDSFAHEPELVRELEKEFLESSGRYVYGGQLLAVLTALRKSANLEKLNLEKYDFRGTFDDLDEAANM